MEEARPLRPRRFDRIMIVRADRAYKDRSEPSAAEVRGLAEPARGIANIGMDGIIYKRTRSIAQQRRKPTAKTALNTGYARHAGSENGRHVGTLRPSPQPH